MPKVNAQELYENIKQGKIKFDEAKHCVKLLEIMADPRKARLSAFCTEVGVSDQTFYNWMKKSDILTECYALGKIISREHWEKEGEAVKEEVTMPGTSNYKFEHWKLIGWSRFGVGKNSRVRLDLNPNDTPDKHYSQLIAQAGNGDFTTSEIKQLMEAINVGLTTQQVIRLQEEINQLKSDLVTMNENTNGHNSITTKGIA
jgi:hypothetical protein